MGLLGRWGVGYKRKRVDRKDSTVFGWRTWTEVGRQTRDRCGSWRWGNVLREAEKLRRRSK